MYCEICQKCKKEIYPTRICECSITGVMSKDNLQSLINELQKSLDSDQPVVFWTRDRKNQHTKFYGTDIWELGSGRKHKII